ncbi:MAG: sensor histidine kinase [Candidatus Aminicenantes bacterium]|nr:sensor histidine kinase [Candidatus Aminicenantes bacterium]
MKEDSRKTKEQLIGELAEMRRQLARQQAVDEKCKQMDDALQKAFDDLEIVTIERTEKLQKANEKLVREINERKRMEKALRQSETRLRRLSSQLFNAQEEERRRLSKELHDQLGHDLVLLKSRLNWIKRKLPALLAEPHKELGETQEYVDQIIENVRRIATELSPSILEDLGLFASLQWLVENFAHQHSIKVSLDMADIDRFFSGETRINLYRVFQETLTNISKHAQAKKVSIVVKKKKDYVIFRVKDDGRGFDLKRLSRKDAARSGMGLTAMKERANLSGGDFDVESTPGNGTVICFKFPVREKGGA